MSLLAASYLFFLGVLMPVLCIRAFFKLKAIEKFPPKLALRLDALIMHALVFLFAWFVWRSFRLPVFPPYAIQVKHVVSGLGILLVFVAGMYPMWKTNALKKRERVYRSVPQAPREMGAWIVVACSAGFAEEIAYRGVLFGILMYWIENWWVAALLCAAAFALGHAIQGWKGVLIIFAMSVIFQGLVWYTGTLYVAIAVHAIYDIIAGFVYLWLYQKTASEVSATATASVM
jgi:membrane protease YdiL (CAAX protease family)